MIEQIIKWPFGPASEEALTASGAQAIDIVNELTIIDGETVEATGNRTLNLAIDENLGVGAIIVAKLKTNGTESTIFGIGMVGNTLVGSAGVTNVVVFVYDGTNFNLTTTIVETVVEPEAAVTLSLTATGAQALAVDTQKTIVDGVTVEATGNRTLNLTIGVDVVEGARLFVKSKTNATETTIFGTAMQGATITGTGGKTKCVEFVYDGINFVEAGTPVQID